MTPRRLNLLVPVDGSTGAERAVEYAIMLAGWGLVDQVHSINVQYPLPERGHDVRGQARRFPAITTTRG